MARFASDIALQLAAGHVKLVRETTSTGTQTQAQRFVKAMIGFIGTNLKQFSH
jgi:hypothetical protein